MEMFREAFELLRRSWVRVLKLYLISFAMAIGILGILGILGIIIYLTKFVFLVLLIIPLIFLFIPLSMAVSAGMMMVVYDEKVGGREALRRGLKKVVPLIGVGVLTTIFVMGGFFVFVIPGLIFMYLLMFSNYEVVLNDKGVIDGMKRSIYMVKSNWQEVLVKVVLFILLSIVVMGIVPSVLTNGGVIGKGFSVIYALIVNPLYAWYGVCYYVILYKSLKGKKPGVTGKGLWVMGVVGIVGWAVFILLLGLAASVLPGVIENMPKPTEYSVPAANQTEWSGETMAF